MAWLQVRSLMSGGQGLHFQLYWHIHSILCAMPWSIIALPVAPVCCKLHDAPSFVMGCCSKVWLPSNFSGWSWKRFKFEMKLFKFNLCLWNNCWWKHDHRMRYTLSSVVGNISDWFPMFSSVSLVLLLLLSTLPGLWEIIKVIFRNQLI